MADKKISELVEHTALSATDVFPVVDSGASATKRVTYDTLATEVRTESEPLSATTVTASGDITSNGETVYHRGNILGTVSQSGGDPTGAIIERGSNANGNYIKYADGTLICTRILQESGTFPAGTEANHNWTFPVSFAGVFFRDTQIRYEGIYSARPYLTNPITNSNYARSRQTGRPTSSSLGSAYPTGSTSSPFREFRDFAIGRWF